MYLGMIETRFLKILLNSFHENYSDLFKTTTRYICWNCSCLHPFKFLLIGCFIEKHLESGDNLQQSRRGSLEKRQLQWRHFVKDIQKRQIWNYANSN